MRLKDGVAEVLSGVDQSSGASSVGVVRRLSRCMLALQNIVPKQEQSSMHLISYCVVVAFFAREAAAGAVCVAVSCGSVSIYASSAARSSGGSLNSNSCSSLPL